MYDQYVSLGSNCEAAFQFRRLLGRDVAYYFNWLVTPIDSLLQIVEADFEGAFAKENLEVTADPDMILDRRFNMKYHSPFRKELGRNLSGERFEQLYADHIGKIELFKQRFRGLARSDQKVLYFIKTDQPEARARASAFRDLMLARYPDHDFDVLLLQTRNKQEADWSEPRVHNRYLRRFAPIEDAGDGHLQSWNKLFEEFPLRAGAMQMPVAVAGGRP